jgi:hypothetical protein
VPYGGATVSGPLGLWKEAAADRQSLSLSLLVLLHCLELNPLFPQGDNQELHPSLG